MAIPPSRKNGICKTLTPLGLLTPIPLLPLLSLLSFLPFLPFLTFLSSLTFLTTLTSTHAAPNDNLVTAESPNLVICVRTNDRWVGFQSPNKLYYALLDVNSQCVVTYKETTLDENETIIFNRFLTTRGLLNDLKKGDEISDKQIEIITGIGKNSKKDLSKLNIEEILKKTTHVSIWDGGEFTEIILGTTPQARDKWPELLTNFLKILYEPSSRAEKVETEGIGFLVPLDKPRKIGEQISWASTLRSLTYNFEQVNPETFKNLPSNLKTMLEFNGFIVPLTVEDLKTMTKLKWEEYPEDIAESTGIPIEKSAMIWWGLIDFKGKGYGINAWKMCQKK